MTAHVLTYPTEQDYLTLDLPFPGATYTIVITQAIRQESLLHRYTATLDRDGWFLWQSAAQDDPALVFAAACEVAFGLWLASQERDGD